MRVHRYIRGTTFCGKIKAVRDTQRTGDFVLIARTEAFIAGYGLEEAIKRADAYYQAGADAILVHSAKSTPEDVISFALAWDNRCPVVIVPTKYGKHLSHNDCCRYSFSMVIWGNHLLRASAQGITRAAREMLRPVT